MEKPEIIHEPENTRFVYSEGENEAEMVYKMRGNTMYFMHTGVPKSISNKKVATELARVSLEYARDQGYKIAVLCPFIEAYVKRHPEWYELYDPHFRLRLKDRK